MTWDRTFCLHTDAQLTITAAGKYSHIHRYLDAVCTDGALLNPQSSISSYPGLPQYWVVNDCVPQHVVTDATQRQRPPKKRDPLLGESAALPAADLSEEKKAKEPQLGDGRNDGLAGDIMWLDGIGESWMGRSGPDRNEDRLWCVVALLFGLWWCGVSGVGRCVVVGGRGNFLKKPPMPSPSSPSTSLGSHTPSSSSSQSSGWIADGLGMSVAVRRAVARCSGAATASNECAPPPTPSSSSRGSACAAAAISHRYGLPDTREAALSSSCAAPLLADLLQNQSSAAELGSAAMAGSHSAELPPARSEGRPCQRRERDG